MVACAQLSWDSWTSQSEKVDASSQILPTDIRCSRRLFVLLQHIFLIDPKEAVMKRWLLLIVLLLAALTNWQGDNSGQTSKPEELSSVAMLVPQDHQQHEAVLTDASTLYRMCSSRPQRVLPSQGAKSKQNIFPPCHLSRRHVVEPLKFLHDGRRRRETAPFCPSVSRLYYVIALRHIIR